jgi:hypothetical protein
MSFRLPPPGEVWRKIKSILVEAIEVEPGPRVYILPERKYVNFRRGAARVSGSDLVESIRLSHSEAGDFVHCALLACENHDVCEMTFTDVRLKVDARIRPAPDTMYKKAVQKLTGLTSERLAFDICHRSGGVYLVLNRNVFQAGLRELSDLLAALDEQKPMTA